MIISQVGSFSFQLHLPKTTHKCRKCDFPDQSDFPLLCRDMSLKPLYSQSIFNVNNAIGGQLECMKESTFIRESWIQVRTFCSKPPSISRLVFSSFFPSRFLFVFSIFHVPTCRDDIVIPYNQFHVYSLGTLLAKIFHFRGTSYWTLDVPGFL